MMIATTTQLQHQEAAEDEFLRQITVRPEVSDRLLYATTS